MYLIVIVWTYVSLMMAVAEATSPVGSVLGAVITFVLYGVLPMGILVYILGTPGRKRKIKARQEAEQAAYDAQQAAASVASATPDAGGEAPAAAQGQAVAPVRKES
jgi:mannose/fructose/N-acetylgalactosamine-specific phosphotransferase system component IID